MFAKALSRFWWMTLLRGVIWILFGITLYVDPAISIVTLVLLFGAFAVVDGIVNIGHAIGGHKENENWVLLLLVGIVGVGVGLLTFENPGLTALALLFYIAIWAVATGVLEVVAAIRLRKEIQGEFWLGLAGLVSIGFGVVVLARPAVGALSVLWLIAGYSIAFGVILVALAFKVRKFVHAAAH
jgi:uncharacterized membrane protein HdeD (DUF308 family)